MKSFILALVLVAPFSASAQPFLVPCPAPDSVVAFYRDDADRLALARTFRNGTTWVDSVAIDPAWAETAMNALVAVYNSDLPARDTVVDMLDIHVWPDRTLTSFYLHADSALPWMQQLSLGNIPTGTPAIDQLLATYGLTLTIYQVFPWGHTATFSTQNDVNIDAMSALFAEQPGVIYAEPNGGCLDGNTITDSVYTDHVNIVYSRGWGDCPAGCTERRYWEFDVFPDCSVEYVGSYGSALPGAMHVPRLQLPDVGIRPNPVNDVLYIQMPRDLVPSGEWEVRDVMGRVVKRGRLESNGSALSVEGMEPGTYLFVLPTTNGPIVKQFIKQ